MAIIQQAHREQRLHYIEVDGGRWQHKDLNDQGLQLEQGWDIVSTSIAGVGYDSRRSFGIVVTLERWSMVDKEVPDEQPIS